jgi:hypothetical protein
MACASVQSNVTNSKSSGTRSKPSVLKLHYARTVADVWSTGGLCAELAPHVCLLVSYDQSFMIYERWAWKVCFRFSSWPCNWKKERKKKRCLMNRSNKKKVQGRRGQMRWMYLQRCWTLWTHHCCSVVTSGASNPGADHTHTHMHALKKKGS